MIKVEFWFVWFIGWCAYFIFDNLLSIWALVFYFEYQYAEKLGCQHKRSELGGRLILPSGDSKAGLRDMTAHAVLY